MKTGLVITAAILALLASPALACPVDRKAIQVHISMIDSFAKRGYSFNGMYGYNERVSREISNVLSEDGRYKARADQLEHVDQVISYRVTTPTGGMYTFVTLWVNQCLIDNQSMSNDDWGKVLKDVRVSRTL